MPEFIYYVACYSGRYCHRYTKWCIWYYVLFDPKILHILGDKLHVSDKVYAINAAVYSI
jgi:hypothetical protein